MHAKVISIYCKLEILNSKQQRIQRNWVLENRKLRRKYTRVLEIWLLIQNKDRPSTSLQWKTDDIAWQYNVKQYNDIYNLTEGTICVLHPYEMPINNKITI